MTTSPSFGRLANRAGSSPKLAAITSGGKNVKGLRQANMVRLGVAIVGQNLQWFVANVGDVVEPVGRDEGRAAGTDDERLGAAVRGHDPDLGLAADAVVELAGVGMPVRLAQPIPLDLRGKHGEPVQGRDVLDPDLPHRTAAVDRRFHRR